MTMRQVMDEAMRRRFERGREEDVFWESHYQGLLAQHPDQWIAFHEGEWIGPAAHIWDLVRLIEERGIDPREAWRTFLNATQHSIKL